VHVELNEGRVTNATEAMDLSCLDDEDVTRARFELFSIDVPETAAFPHELHFIVGMTMRSGTTPGEGAEEKHRDVDVAVIGADELVRASLKWQVLLADSVHVADAPILCSDGLK
jgi:hypothetical protein